MIKINDKISLFSYCKKKMKGGGVVPPALVEKAKEQKIFKKLIDSGQWIDTDQKKAEKSRMRNESKGGT